MNFDQFSLKNKWFLGYSLAVLVLGGRLLWFHFHPSNLPILVDWAVRDVVSAKQLIEKICWISKGQISRVADAYHYPINEGLRNDASMLDSLFDIAQSFEPENGRKPAEIDQFLDNLDTLLGRVGQIVDQDSTANAAFLSVFPERSIGSERGELAELLSSADYAPALLAYCSIIWKAKIAYYRALEALNNRTWEPDNISFEAFLPMISADFTRLRHTGQLVGEIYLASYSSKADNVSFKIDGVPTPNDHGIGHWSKIYQTPGRRKLNLQCIVKNPLTGEMRNYSREFDLVVIP